MAITNEDIENQIAALQTKAALVVHLINEAKGTGDMARELTLISAGLAYSEEALAWTTLLRLRGTTAVVDRVVAEACVVGGDAAAAGHG